MEKSQKRIKEKEEIKSLLCKILNQLRLDTRSSFSKLEFETSINLPKVKKSYIIRELLNSGVIISVGKGRLGELLWFKDSKIPIEFPISEALRKYYLSFGYSNKRIKKEKGKSMIEDKEMQRFNEEECIKFLLNTGMYQILRKEISWKELILD